jgi:prolyl-tRNA synthetase
VPVLSGRKTDAERFAGAEYTLSIEGMMRDGLALQMGTSHHLGQNFSRAYDITFTNRDNEREHCYTTSWGISTRLIGGVVMAHGDDSGLVLPPRVASVQVVVVPIFRDEPSRVRVADFVEPLVRELRSFEIRHRVDWRDDVRPGEKWAHWELRGVPLRVEVGPRDIDAGQVVLVDRLSRERRQLKAQNLGPQLRDELERYQRSLFQRALDFRSANTLEAEALSDLIEAFSAREVSPFVWAGWCGSGDCEAQVKAETGGVTIRNFQEDQEFSGKCVFCQKPAHRRVVFARSY